MIDKESKPEKAEREREMIDKERKAEKAERERWRVRERLFVTDD